MLYRLSVLNLFKICGFNNLSTDVRQMLYRKDVSVLKLFNRLVMNDNKDNLGQQFGAFF